MTFGLTQVKLGQLENMSSIFGAFSTFCGSVEISRVLQHKKQEGIIVDTLVAAGGKVFLFVCLCCASVATFAFILLLHTSTVLQFLGCLVFPWLSGDRRFGGGLGVASVEFYRRREWPGVTGRGERER